MENSLDAILEEIKKLKTAIAYAKERKARKEGEYQAAMGTLKQEFEVQSLEEADALLKEYEADIAARTRMIESLLGELRQEYEW